MARAIGRIILVPIAFVLAALVTLLSPFTPMIFQGDEYGETAPFQFFSDHIDEDIATATRDGRRREFAAFAEFRGREVPDPQDPATFEASKLTRTGEPEGLGELYAELLFEAYKERIPPAGTRVTLVLAPKIEGKPAEEPAVEAEPGQ